MSPDLLSPRLFSPYVYNSSEFSIFFNGRFLYLSGSMRPRHLYMSHESNIECLSSVRCLCILSTHVG